MPGDQTARTMSFIEKLYGHRPPVAGSLKKVSGCPGRKDGEVNFLSINRQSAEIKGK